MSNHEHDEFRFLDNLKFGDRIAVRSAGVEIDEEGIFIRIQGNNLVWVGLGTRGAFAGQPTIFVTNLNAITVEKLV